jgi:hypothetical protein
MPFRTPRKQEVLEAAKVLWVAEELGNYHDVEFAYLAASLLFQRCV